MNMNQIAKSKVAVLLSGLLAAVVPVLVQAANQPDAGTLLDTVRSKDFASPKKPDPGIDVQQESQPAAKHTGGYKTKVTAFHITGATVFTEAQLQSRVASLVGQELTLADLEKVAAEISRFYRSNGYFVARAYLPAQEIKDGVVEIAVLEGRVGNVGVKLKGDGRLSEFAVKRIIAGSAKQGDVINESQLERGLLLANDLAGVSVDSTLIPGSSVGTSDLVVEARQTGSVSGGIDYDNFGNKFTGSSRVGASVNLNNSFGDQVALRVMTSGSGLRYGRVSYLLPVGAAGTKLGAAYSVMDYKLEGAFSSVNGEGDAKIASLYAIHPFIRSRNNNLYGQLGYDSKNMVDKAGGATNDDKHDDLYMAGLSGDSRDSLGGGGINSYSATFFSGKLDLGANPNYLGLDAKGPQTNGSFNKTDYSVSRVQRLTDEFSLYTAFSGQFTSKNLDSSEKFVLGGAAGVRAYPQGEASGDQGQLLNLELRRDLGGYAYGNLQFLGFFDVGNIQLNRNTWTNWQGTNSSLHNNYSLVGAGLGINLSKAGSGDNLGGYSVKAYLAAKIGTNQGADAKGNDSDGTHSAARFWLQANKWF